MISALILLAIWAVLLNCFLPKLVTKHVTYIAIIWSILFACALATSSTIYFIQINALPNLASNKWIIGIESIASLGYLLFGFKKASLASKLVIPFKAEAKTTKTLVAAGITALFIFAVLTSAPLNWDSNAYNVARVSTILSESSTVLDPNTASGRQAIFAIGHDILLYPDISFGILRGLPMVSLLEFFVLLGALLSLSKAFRSAALVGKSNLPMVTGMITTILLFNTHQQVMQALITKNDLAITLLFTISIATGINYLYEQHKPLSERIVMSSMILMLCTAINMKSYGIILIFPTGLIALIIITRRLATNQLKAQTSDSNNQDRLHKLLIILGITTLISFSIQTTLVHQAWLNAPINRINSITNAWTNQSGSWGDRLENSLVNSGRILLQGSLFPYTALKPYLPIGPEMRSPIDNSIIPEVFQGDRGSASGSFELLYGTNPDMAYPFFVFQMGLILGLLGWCLGRPQKGLAGAFFIMTSSGLTFLFFSSALLYQPWISRFMGPVYIPLIPLVAIGICLLLQRLPYAFRHQQGLMKNIAQICAFLVGILPLISSMSLTGYLSRRGGMPQRKSDFYNQYLWSQTGLSKQKANELIDNLKSGIFNYRYLCSSDGRWTLTPMVLSQANQSFKGNNIKLLNSDKCQKKSNKLTGSSMKLDPGQSVLINGAEFISLP